jgi:hypothetical protein
VQDTDRQRVRTDKRLPTGIIRNLMCALKSVERENQILHAFQRSQTYGPGISRYCTSVHTVLRDSSACVLAKSDSAGASVWRKFTQS